jgi:hypothetical protein
MSSSRILCHNLHENLKLKIGNVIFVGSVEDEMYLSILSYWKNKTMLGD